MRRTEQVYSVHKSVACAPCNECSLRLATSPGTAELRARCGGGNLGAYDGSCAT